MATFVLVHGGMHGGWCYKPLAQLLRAEGHEVHCPTLTGSGERSHLRHPGITLETHIEDVCNLLFYEDLHDVYLAGHSYGGMVITGVADRALGRVGHLVFLDASHPKDGEALTDVAPGMMGMAGKFKKTIDVCEVVELPEDIGRPNFGFTDDDLWAFAGPRLTPQMWSCFTSKLSLNNEEAVRALPRTSINCTETLAKRPPELVHRATEADHLYEIDTGHALMLSETRKVADMLLEVVAKEGAAR
jgi:pimeloyl-ACP methyl ester carboxylesterase